MSVGTNFKPWFLQCEAFTSLLVGLDLAVRLLPLVDNSPTIGGFLAEVFLGLVLFHSTMTKKQRNL